MGKRLVRSMLLVFVWSVAGTSVAADAGSVRAVPDGQFVLEQIQKRLETISNYQCTQITTRVRWNRRDPNRVAEDIDRKSIAYDREGRRRVREVSENLDARTYIWDGTQTIEVCERVERNGTVVYSASVFPGQCDQVTGGHLPWRYLGEFLARALKSALASGRAIHVGRIENGCCRLEFYTGGRTAIVAILDPARGYLPILEAHLPPGGAGQWEEIESREIEPGVWFPVAVRTRSSQAQTPASVQAVPRLRFTDIRVNDPDFARLLAPELPTGSTVADMVRGARHVVDRNRALNVSGGESSSSRAEEAERADGWDLDGEQEGIESVYRLDVNEVLKRIAPPFVAGRGAFILRHEPDVAPALEEAFENTVYVWQGGGDEKPTVRYAGMGFLSLSEILQGVCGLEIIEYHGPEDLLGLRLTGDWMVRRGAGKEVLLRSLERIVYEETSLRIRFEKHRVETPVVRATGIFQYHGLGGTWGEVDVQLFSEAPEAYRSPYRTGAGSGCLAELLRHTGNRISRPFVDDTLSSDVVVSWSDYRSSKLNPLTMDRKRYRQDLARLLDNLAKQTGLTFTEERRAIDRWDVGISP